MSITTPEIPTKLVLHKISVEQGYSNSLLKVASQYYYVFFDASIEAVSRELEENPEILSLGVLDHDLRLLGIIERAYFFYLLGRPFGRDILVRKMAIEIAQDTQRFPFDMNIFTAAADLSKLNVSRDRVQYYSLTDDDRRFYGTFSSIDLLTFMSQITQQDIALAANLQSRLVLDGYTITKENVSFFGFTQSAKGMGGDFYGVYEIPRGEWFFTLCDVSGKGVAASVITSLLWGMLRTTDWRRGLGSTIQEINHALIQTFHLEKYLTGVFGIYSPTENEVRLADMGHSFSFLERRGKLVKLEGAHLNLPVGIEMDLQPRIVRIKVEKGDLLTFVTDGVPEQVSRNGEIRDEDAWVKVLNRVFLEEKEPRSKIIEQFDSFRGGAPQADDLSALFMRVL